MIPTADRDPSRVPPVVYMHHLPFKPIVNKIGENLIADTGRAIADHIDDYTQGEVQAEEYAV